VVGQDHAEPSTSLEDEAETFPQWGIAVLVIGLAAIAFVVIFGVSMVSKLLFHVSLEIFCLIKRKRKHFEYSLKLCTIISTQTIISLKTFKEVAMIPRFYTRYRSSAKTYRLTPVI
jgi:hypothetical protein